MATRSLCLRSHEVRGLLDGSVTALRRVVKPQPPALVRKLACNERGQLVGTWEDDGAMFVRPGLGPFGAPGDVLVGKETWAAWWENGRPERVLGYRCDCPVDGEFADDPWWEHCDWIPPQRMPRWAARLFLEVLEVRVERDEEGVWTWVARVKRTERPE